MTDLRTPSTGEAFGGVQCAAVRPSIEPDLMAWDAQDRASLKAISSAGIVAVRYEGKGCDVRLEVLSNCTADGKYGFDASPANDTKITRNAQELFTALPLGAARLAGKVQKGRALRTDYMQVGVRLLPPGTVINRNQLHGEGCERATHIVSRIVVGGFGMVAMDERAVETSANVFGVGAGGGVTGHAERIMNEGVPSKCEEAQKEGKESAVCGTPLRLALQALDAGAAQQCPRGTTWTGSACTGRCPSGMARIPAGRFQMGSNSGDADERPIHGVTLDAFCMDMTEVTVGAYRACVRTGSCASASSTVDWPNITDGSRILGTFCNWGMAGKDNHPVNCLDWEASKAYCQWANKRLPSEEEWEYAARGSEGRMYPWGEAEPAPGLLSGCFGECKAWLANNGLDQRVAHYGATDGWDATAPVGSFPTGDSTYGLNDMAGNVWEWTESWYSKDYNEEPAKTTRVVRGGGWFPDAALYTRSSYRYGAAPSIRSSFLGFRCAQSGI